MEKLKIDRPIIVEGKYDKIALSAVLDATIIPTNGFSLFNDKEKLALLRRLAHERGVILLTDADGGGKLIRAKLTSALPQGAITQLYIPTIEGKEKRKKAPSKEGLLGVEGMEAERLYAIFAPFATDAPPRAHTRPIEKRDFYADGLSGGANAAAARDALAELLDLPRGMSANALLAALNLLYPYDEYRAALTRLSDGVAEKAEVTGQADPEKKITTDEEAASKKKAATDKGASPKKKAAPEKEAATPKSTERGRPE